MLTSVMGGKSPQRFIKCQATIALQYNSLAVAALVDRLEYWFGRKKNKFYKFLSPCNHYRYRHGDSWTEELGIDHRVFRRAFAKIGVAYKSLSHYRDASDKFQGYPYACYYHRQDNQLFFLKNPAYHPETDQLSVQQSGHDSYQHNSIACTPRIGRQARRLQVQGGDALRLASYGLQDKLIDAPMIVLHDQCEPDFDDTVFSDIPPQRDEPVAARGAAALTDDINIKYQLHHLPPSDDQGKQTTYPTLEALQSDNPAPQMTINQNRVTVAPDHNKRADAMMAQKDRFVVDCYPQLLKSGLSRKYHNGISSIRVFNTLQRRHSISFKEKESVDKFKKKAFLAFSPTSPQTPSPGNCLNKRLAQQMIAIWQNVIGDPKLRFIANTLLSRLSEALARHFDRSLFTWREYCLKIASSKFLMGESKAWILKDGVYLIWAIQDENIAKVQSNRIGTGDRVLTLSANQQVLNQERVQIREQIKELESQLQDPQRQVQIQRHQQVITQVNALLKGADPAVLSRYQDAFESAVNQGTGPAIQQLTEPTYQAVISRAWRTQCRARKGRSDNPWWHFTSYLVEALATQHFGQDEDQMVAKLQNQATAKIKQLMDRLTVINLNY